MKELEQAFYEYIEQIKKLDTKYKRNELILSIKEIIVGFEAMAKNDAITLNKLKSNEIFDLKEGAESEDDFLEAAIVYLEVAKNLMGEYLNIKLD